MTFHFNPLLASLPKPTVVAVVPSTAGFLLVAMPLMQFTPLPASIRPIFPAKGSRCVRCSCTTGGRACCSVSQPSDRKPSCPSACKTNFSSPKQQQTL